MVVPGRANRPAAVAIRGRGRDLIIQIMERGFWRLYSQAKMMKFEAIAIHGGSRASEPPRGCCDPGAGARSDHPDNGTRLLETLQPGQNDEIRGHSDSWWFPGERTAPRLLRSGGGGAIVADRTDQRRDPCRPLRAHARFGVDLIRKIKIAVLVSHLQAGNFFISFKRRKKVFLVHQITRIEGRALRMPARDGQVDEHYPAASRYCPPDQVS